MVNGDEEEGAVGDVDVVGRAPSDGCGSDEVIVGSGTAAEDVVEIRAAIVGFVGGGGRVGCGERGFGGVAGVVGAGANVVAPNVTRRCSR